MNRRQHYELGHIVHWAPQTTFANKGIDQTMGCKFVENGSSNHGRVFKLSHVARRR